VGDDLFREGGHLDGVDQGDQHLPAVVLPAVQHWHSICYARFESTWRCAFHHMTSPNDVTEDLVNLCAQHKRSRHHQMFAGMLDGGKRAGERKWACRFYELLASNAPIAEFIPAHQQARAIGDLTEFWSGKAAMEQMAAFLRSLSQKVTNQEGINQL
jgi:hypothetical protein